MGATLYTHSQHYFLFILRTKYQLGDLDKGMLWNLNHFNVKKNVLKLIDKLTDKGQAEKISRDYV